jgi:hypothetical protein
LLRSIIVEFEKGGNFEINLLDENAPVTCEYLWNQLPIDTTCIHGRVPGRTGKEIAVKINLRDLPPREYQTIYPDLGDVTYWREWESDYLQMSYMETLGIYYGVGRSFDLRGYSPLTVFGRIDIKQHKDLATVGTRIWRKGGEKIRLIKKEA